MVTNTNIQSCKLEVRVLSHVMFEFEVLEYIILVEVLNLWQTGKDRRRMHIIPESCRG